MAGEAFIDGENGPEVAPQGGEIVLPNDEKTRRQFLATLGIAGAGAGAATAYAYGPEGDTAGGIELAADDPEFPEQESSLMTEGTDATAMLELAEDIAAQIESGAIQLDAETSAAAGIGGAALLAGKAGEQQISRRKLVAGLLGGTILLSADQFAQAQERGGVTFVAYNYNSNARNDGEPDGDELLRLERTRGRRMTLEEFTRTTSCESPRGARLFGEHEAVKRHNAEVQRKKAAGERNPGTERESPITMFRGWYKKPSTAPGSNMEHSFFRLKDQVAVTGADGRQSNVYKHYGVAQKPNSRTRQPHNLLWSGYMGTDARAATVGMTRVLGQL